MKIQNGNVAQLDPETLPATEATKVVTIDGNEAAAYVAYRTNGICAIYPITPASFMAELCDQWASEKKTNIWGSVPTVVEMQSEMGAAGVIHGAVQGGSLVTTFTASQGLMLMIPNMFRIAGELSPFVMHVATRSLATSALSIFCDHQDVMATRQTGFAMLCSGSVQEVHDFALIAQAATLEARIPFSHFFDGFRTSHEVNKVVLLSDAQMKAMLPEALILKHRQLAMNPDHPFMRSTVQNSDVYFQTRESVNPWYDACPGIVVKAMERFAEVTGRKYRPFEYFGAPDAERVVMLMGSGAETARETIEYLHARGEKVGVVHVHLYRPFVKEMLMEALPASVRAVAVLDRCKESGAGDPLYLDTVAAFHEAHAEGILPMSQLPKLVAGRYGMGGKEFSPAMVKAILDNLDAERPRNRFTVGIQDDVTYRSLDFDPAFSSEPDDVFRAVFYGLGSDGTVSANKNTIKILGEDPDFHAQGYFVYDSKKSGSQTVSHVRFGRNPIRSTYLIRQADFVGCHQFGFVSKMDVLALAAPGATFLLNSPYPADEVWDHLPRPIQQGILDKGLKFFVIDANRVAREVGMGSRTNTIMQTCFFAISGLMPREQAMEKIRAAVRKSYGKRGEEVVRKNFEAMDRTVEELREVAVPPSATSRQEFHRIVPEEAPPFVQK